MAENQEFVAQVIGMADDLEKHLQEFQTLALQAQPTCGAMTGGMISAVMEDASQWEDVVKRGLELGAEFANRGMELGFVFASRGMELGFEFASRGEEVGPMANRVLFMATQIGVMADRIGEMGDRILSMSDRIVEFGNKIVYVSQLVLYTEQLIVNVSTLITETIRIISDLILTLVALASGNETYLQQRIEHLKASNALPLVYENMNLMLRQMHEYSMKALENERAAREDEIKIREQQIRLREVTLSANDCFCPCFCTSGTPENTEGDGGDD
jgi:hypothetical protein